MSCRSMTNVLLLLLWMSAFSQQSLAQIPTPAPAAPEDPASSQAEDKKDAPARELLAKALQSYAAKDFKTTAEAFERVLEDGPAMGMPLELMQASCLLYADVLCELHDYPAAIHVLNVLSSSRPADDLLYQKEIISKRIDAYDQLMWSSVMFDEARFALRLDPTDTSVQAKLLIGLIYEPCPTLRNPGEVLSILKTMETKIEEIPTIARLIAVTAGETGDFDRAVDMQQRYIESGKSEDVELDAKLLESYKRKLKFIPPSPPEIDTSKILTREQLTEVARSSMVNVRVHRRLDGENAVAGSKNELAFVHEHVGTVIDSLGTILVCEETVRLPRNEDMNPSNAARKWQWPREPVPVIEIYSIPNKNEESKLLGSARVIGTDEATGIAVIEMERKGDFAFTRLEQKAATFAPEYRSFDPNTEAKLSRTFELVVNPDDSPMMPRLRETVLTPHRSIEADESRDRARPTVSETDINAGQGPIGTPYFNELGECIGIRDQDGIDDQEGSFSIPSTVCIRIAAKLATYGGINRTNLKFIVNSVPTNSSDPSRGMFVAKMLYPEGNVYEPLAGKIIVSLDGCSTPTIVEWLRALESSYARELKTITFGVYNPATDVTEFKSFPIPDYYSP